MFKLKVNLKKFLTVKIELYEWDKYYYLFSRKFRNPFKYFKFLDYLKDLKLNIKDSYSLKFVEISEKDVKIKNNPFDTCMNVLEIGEDEVVFGLPLRGLNDSLIYYTKEPEKFNLGTAYNIILERK